jgi:hypothetical protein
MNDGRWDPLSPRRTISPQGAPVGAPFPNHEWTQSHTNERPFLFVLLTTKAGLLQRAWRGIAATNERVA